MGGHYRVLGGDLEHPGVAGENPLFPKFQSQMLQQNPVRYENLMNRLEPFEQPLERFQQRLEPFQQPQERFQQRLEPFQQRQELQRQKIKGLLGGIDPGQYQMPSQLAQTLQAISGLGGMRFGGGFGRY